MTTRMSMVNEHEEEGADDGCELRCMCSDRQMRRLRVQQQCSWIGRVVSRLNAYGFCIRAPLLYSRIPLLPSLLEKSSESSSYIVCSARDWG